MPDFIPDSLQLITQLRTLSVPDLMALMDLSESLSQLNAIRYADWTPEFTPKNAKQAVFCFAGDVYDGLDAASLSAKQINYIQSRVRILSGLYGILRPLDLMQPYRLEMGTRLANTHGKDLYAFWGQRLTTHLQQLIDEAGHKTLLNLASDEYFKVVKPKLLSIPVVSPVFEDWKNGQFKIISFFAKRARGSMARFAAQHAINSVKKLREFGDTTEAGGYTYTPAVSTPERPVFRRTLPENV
jgi:cytoplasmic iron level regulating protein YaaA (DUF328/UPF0246 family)